MINLILDGNGDDEEDEEGEECANTRTLIIFLPLLVCLCSKLACFYLRQ